MILCINCGNKEIHQFVFIKDWYICKCCDSKDGDKVIEVDELISESVLLLNQKGFETIHSCEGHHTGNNQSNFSGSVGYLTIVDDGKVLNDLESIPDEIGNFIISSEISTGPKNISELNNIITKIVIRFNYNNNKIIENNYRFFEEKIKFFEELTNIIRLIERK